VVGRAGQRGLHAAVHPGRPRRLRPLEVRPAARLPAPSENTPPS
jgi:hypothetical protein